MARIKILIYTEKYLKTDEFLLHWKNIGRPYLDLLLIDCATLNLEAYQKCKILILLR